MPTKVASLDDAIGLVTDGARIGGGGVLLDRKPIGFLDALTRAGVTDLRYHSFLGSLDVELLVVRGAVAEVHTGYVGFEQMGFAPRYLEAVTNGTITAHEYSEFLFVAGLRAAAAGLPFMPAKGGTGSEIVTQLGFVEIDDPYGAERVLAVPRMALDVVVLHADTADVHGNVAAPPDKTFLWDSDAMLARAGDRVVVTAEALVDDVREMEGRDILLVGYEVDAVVELPDGARPTAMAGRYPAQRDRIAKYLDAAGGGDPGHAMDALLT